MNSERKKCAIVHGRVDTDNVRTGGGRVDTDNVKTGGGGWPGGEWLWWVFVGRRWVVGGRAVSGCGGCSCVGGGWWVVGR
jgi:hypothetical protein